ncbi:MAG: type II toxin-antitoxin system HicA family toxin [Candidatus Omnitrophica bacterium]|nr:type II toxin-antitoxin system HicA family toxin [Candidatus Omnitrophota bacterium]
MKRESKIYFQAQNSQANVSFDDLCFLIEKIGYVLRAGGGSSHVIYKHSEIKNITDSMLNVQKFKDGKAKPYQVRKVLEIIDCYDLLEKIKEGGGENG